MPNTLERWQVHWDQLLLIVNNAKVAGQALGVQANVDGTTGIQNVEQVAPPEIEVFPGIGIQFTDYAESQNGMRRHEVVSSFDIVIAVKQPFDPAVADTSRAALSWLRNYVNDGNGNGLSPLLRGNPTLNGTCVRGYILNMTYAVLQSDNSTAGTIATAIYKYQTDDLVKY